VDLSYCVVNTNGGELLAKCLDAIEADRPAGLESEILVLDNASDDGSPEFARRTGVRLIELDRRTGKAANDSRLLRESAGRYCLLLNEDSELLPGASAALTAALDEDPRAGAAGAQLLDGDDVPQPCAWRFPGVATSLLQALQLHRWLVVQSGGVSVTRVDWAQSAALLVRTEASDAVDRLDEDFFVYGDEVDFCKRMSDTGWHTIYVPAARARHREGLSHGEAARRRIREFHRGRDLYMSKHHFAPARYAVRLLTAASYTLRALAAAALPGHDAWRYWFHARTALNPWPGEGLHEAAQAYNRALDASVERAADRS
jgi:GT2 family glycosyltransferase